MVAKGKLLNIVEYSNRCRGEIYTMTSVPRV